MPKSLAGKSLITQKSGAAALAEIESLHGKVQQGVDFSHADARQMVGKGFSSGASFQAAHKWLADNGLLGQAPGSGGSCGVG